MAAVQSERVFEVIQPFCGRFVATIDKPAPSLEKPCRPEKAVAIPPMARTTRGAAEAQDALIVTIEPATLLR